MLVYFLFYFLHFLVLIWMGGIFSRLLFPLLSSSLCGLWLNRGFLFKLGARLLATGMTSFRAGILCLSWVLGLNDEERKRDWDSVGGIRGNLHGHMPEVLAASVAYGSVQNICLNWDLENKVKKEGREIMNSIRCGKQKVGGHGWARSLPGVVAAGMTSDLAYSLHLSSPICSSHLHLSTGCPTQAGDGTHSNESGKLGEKNF